MAKKKKDYMFDDKSLMLLAAAAAVIVGFFAIFAYKSNSITMPTPTPQSQIMTINLDTQNKSGEMGTATLQEVNGKVVVTISMTGYQSSVTQPAHIHIGACPTPGAVKFPLTSLVNGSSVTTLNTTLAALKAMEPLAINVHKSVSQSNIYYACGDLN